MQEETVTVPLKELKELRKAFLMLRGLFDTSLVYADRLSPADMSNKEILANNLTIGQMKAQQFLDKAKQLEGKGC